MRTNFKCIGEQAILALDKLWMVRGESVLDRILIHPRALEAYDNGRRLEQGVTGSLSPLKLQDVAQVQQSHEIREGIAHKITGYETAADFYIDTLAQSLEQLIPTIPQEDFLAYVTTDFIVNHQVHLQGFELFEQREADTLLGHRGLDRVLAEENATLFAWEIEALKRVQHHKPDLIVLFPFVRRPQALEQALECFRSHGFVPQGIGMLIQIPAHGLSIDNYLAVLQTRNSSSQSGTCLLFQLDDLARFFLCWSGGILTESTLAETIKDVANYASNQDIAYGFYESDLTQMLHEVPLQSNAIVHWSSFVAQPLRLEDSALLCPDCPEFAPGSSVAHGALPSHQSETVRTIGSTADGHLRDCSPDFEELACLLKASTASTYTQRCQDRQEDMLQLVRQLEDAATLWGQLGLESAVANCARNIAMAWAVRNELKETIQPLQKARHFDARNRHPEKLAESDFLLGIALKSQELYTHALFHLEEEYRLLTNMAADPVKVTLCRQQLAQALIAMGRWSEALEHLIAAGELAVDETALLIQLGQVKWEEMARPYKGLGEAPERVLDILDAACEGLWKTHDAAKAMEALNLNAWYLQVAHQCQSDELMANGYFTRANILYVLGRSQEALEALGEAEQLHRRLDNKLGLARIYRNKAVILREVERLGEALESLAKSYAFYPERRDPKGAEAVLNEMSIIFLSSALGGHTFAAAGMWGERTTRFVASLLELVRRHPCEEGLEIIEHLPMIRSWLQALPSAELHALCLHSAIRLHVDLGTAELALHAFNKLQFLHQEPLPSLVEAEICTWLAESHIRHSPQQALSYAQRASEILQGAAHEAHPTPFQAENPLAYYGELFATLGKFFEQLREFKEAASSYTAAAGIFQKVDASEMELQICLKLGAMQQQRFELLAARKSLDRAVDLAQSLNNKTAEAIALVCLGRVHGDEHELDRALQCYNNALDLLHLEDELPQRHALMVPILINRSQAYMYQSTPNWRTALQDANTAIEMAIEAQDLSGEAWARRARGHIHYFRGQMAEALEDYKRSLQICQDQRLESFQVETLLALGMFYEGRGGLQEAEHYLLQAQHLAQEIKDELNEEWCSLRLGAVHLARGNYAETLALCINAHKRLQVLGVRHSQVECLNLMGIAYRHLFQLESALQTFTAALQISREIPDIRGEAGTLTNLGLLYSENREDPEKAIEYQKQAVALYKKIDFPHGVAIALSNLGNALAACWKQDPSNTAALEESLRCFEEAAVLHKQLDEKENLANDIMNMGNGHLYQHDPSKAEGYFAEAAALFEETRSPLGIAKIYHNMLSHLSVLRQLRKTQFGPRLERLMMDPSYFESLVTSMQAAGAPPQAILKKLRNIDYADRSLEHLDETGLIKRVLEYADRSLEYLESLREELPVRQWKEAFATHYLSFYQLPLAFCLDYGEGLWSLRYLERAITAELKKMIDERLLPSESTPQLARLAAGISRLQAEHERELHNLDTQMNRGQETALDLTPGKMLRQKLETLRTEAELSDETFRARRGLRTHSLSTLQEFQALLPSEDMSLLEFCLMPGQEAVFSLTRHLGLQAFRYPKGTTAALAQAYDKWNAVYQEWRQHSDEPPGNAYECAWFREIRETCRVLRQRLLESELTPITGGPSTTLYSLLDTQMGPTRAAAKRHKLLIVPHITSELPLHACIDNVGHALIQKYDVGFIHSANLLRKLLERQRFIRKEREGQKNKRVLLINDPKKGHPVHHWRWSLESPRALGEPTEAHEIRRLYEQAGAHVDFIEGGSATVANVQCHLESHYYDNVIFSGHSVYDFSQPWDSCLLLYDAPLFLKHVAQWSLKGIGNLALFSCESKLGKPDFLQNSISIATVFMILGVESVIASQWSVGLQATKDFMERTYTLHLEERLRLAEAFCQAQRERAEMEEPFDWAGFIWSGLVS